MWKGVDREMWEGVGREMWEGVGRKECIKSERREW